MKTDTKQNKKKKVSNKRKFTDEEFLELYNKKVWLAPPLSDRQMAEILGTSTAAITLRRYKLNLLPHVRTFKKSNPENSRQKLRKSQNKASKTYLNKSKLRNT